MAMQAGCEDNPTYETERTHVYGPRGAPLFPTPLLSKTSTEYSGLRPKCCTWGSQPAELEFSLVGHGCVSAGVPYEHWREADLERTP